MKNLSYIVVLTFVLFANQNVFAHKEVESDSLKKEYWLTFSSICIPKDFGYFLSFGLAIEKQMNNAKKTKVFSFYNTYNNSFKGDANTATRFTSLTLGFNYNLLKKHKLNIGLHGGLFLRDAYWYFQGTLHGFGITLSPQIEYRYCFNKTQIGIDFLYFPVYGKFKIPSTSLWQPTIDDISYETKYDFGLFGYLNLKISKKL